MLFDFTEPERNTMRRALELYVSRTERGNRQNRKATSGCRPCVRKRRSQGVYRTVECLSARTLPAGT